MTKYSEKERKIPEENIPQLIEAVKKREFLWNPKHEKFKSRYLCMEAWMNIAAECDVTVTVARSRFKNLKDTFKREIKRTRCTNPEDYKGVWKHFQAMSFLHNWDGSEDFFEEYLEEDRDDSEENKNPSYKLKLETLSEEQDQPCEQDYEHFSVDLSPPPAKRSKVDDDEYDLMFLKSLLPYFRQLQPLKKLIIRSRMQDMILSELSNQVDECK